MVWRRCFGRLEVGEQHAGLVRLTGTDATGPVCVTVVDPDGRGLPLVRRAVKATPTLLVWQGHLRDQVLRARIQQAQRFPDGTLNARMDSRQLKKFCELSDGCLLLMKQAMESTARLVGFLMKTYRIPASNVIGHNVAKSGRTSCPGRYFSVAQVRGMAVCSAGYIRGRSRRGQRCQSTRWTCGS